MTLSERVEEIRKQNEQNAVNQSLDFDNIETRIQSNTVTTRRSDDGYESPDYEAKEQSTPERLIGNATTRQSIEALLLKRFQLYKRDKTAIMCEVVVPVLLVFIGCLLNSINYSQKSYTIDVTPDLYPSP